MNALEQLSERTKISIAVDYRIGAFTKPKDYADRHNISEQEVLDVLSMYRLNPSFHKKVEQEVDKKKDNLEHLEELKGQSLETYLRRLIQKK